MVSIIHDFVNSIPTDPAATAAGKLTPDRWNADHDITCASATVVLGNKEATGGPAEELTLSQVLDMIGSAAWGDIFFRSATGWVRLAVGSAGQFLQSAGVGADLAWGSGALLSAIQTWQKAQISNPSPLVDSGGVALDLSKSNEFTITLGASNTTLLNPTNIATGQSGSIKITQPATPVTLAYGTFYKFPGGTVPSLTATAAACDTLYYSVRAPQFIECVLVKGFA